MSEFQAELAEVCRRHIPSKLHGKANAMARLLGRAIENRLPGRVVEFPEGRNLDETEGNRMARISTAAAMVVADFLGLLHAEPGLKKCAYAFDPDPVGFGIELVDLGVVTDRCVSPSAAAEDVRDSAIPDPQARSDGL